MKAVVFLVIAVAIASAAAVQLDQSVATDVDLVTKLKSFASCYSADGSGNNPIAIQLGRAGSAFKRLCPFGYSDNVWKRPIGPDSRLTSNRLEDSNCDDIPNEHCANDLFWAFGQFVAHDLALTMDGTEQQITVNIDTSRDPDRMSSVTMMRSAVDKNSNPREQTSGVTSFLDLSQVYGSDNVRSASLKDPTNSAFLSAARTLAPQRQEFLPQNVMGVDGRPVTSNQPSEFPNTGSVAGDIRATEHQALFMLQALFLRMHNRFVRQLMANPQKFSNEELFKLARALNIAVYQSIVYREFLPVYIGLPNIRPFRGYDNRIDPRVSNEFSTVAYRSGHSLVGCRLHSFAEDSTPITSVSIEEGFFNPQTVLSPPQFDGFLRGLVLHRAQQMDTKVSDSLRNRLFSRSDRLVRFDLTVFDIERARDHGMPPYSVMRSSLGLGVPVGSLSSIVDSFIGVLAEPHLNSSQLGELGTLIIADQFDRSRTGDRCYYETLYSTFPKDFMASIHNFTMAEVIRQNSGAQLKSVGNAFVVPGCLLQ
jgi:peroxidase